MTSSEADKFMGKHSSMAVRIGADGIWIAWDLFISKYPFDTDLVYGFTREEAVSIRDSAKYRRIVDLYKVHQKGRANGLFMVNVLHIIKDDLKPTRCDKCGQELP
jgi:hypothetical protein